MRFRSRVYVATPDGDVELVSPEGGLYYQASMHPQGQDLVFYGGRTGFPRLWRRDLRNGNIEALTDGSSGARHGVYSWDGRWIAFASDRASPTPGERVEDLYAGTRTVRSDVQLHLYVGRRDGREVRQITDGPFRDLRPTFTPDGRSLVFASDRRPGPTLWIVGLDPPSTPRLLFDGRPAYRPWCTPGADSVIFYGADRRRDRLFLLDVVSGLERALSSDDRGTTHGPFVLPDGKHVLAHSTRGGDWGLWEFPLDDTTRPRCVTPAGFARASHPTRSLDGQLAFDVVMMA